MSKEIKVFSPATVANVACGFDIFGFALDFPGDEVTVKLVEGNDVKITKIEGEQGRLSLDPQKNTAGVSVIKFLEHLKIQQGVEISLIKKMPLGSGLGSSAASTVGSLFAINKLLDEPLTKGELLPFAMVGEFVACGSAHADNVAPSLLGGFTLIRSYEPLDVVSIPCGLDLFCTIVHPKIEISTEKARKILKPDVTLKQHVIQSGNVAGLVVGLMKGNVDLIRNSLQDVIIEPIRATLIPGFQEIKSAAIKEGALGCSISGSGPSIFALSLSQQEAEGIGDAMARACRNHLDCDVYISKINLEGPRVLS